MGPVGERFELLRVLGRGSYGEAHLAADLSTGLHVVVKLLHARLLDQTTPLERFRREVRALAKLRHPNVVQLVATGTCRERRQPYYAMTWSPGLPLDRVLEEHELLAPDLALRLTDQLLSALEAAAVAGVVHRDLKPGNLIVESLGDGDERLLVIDFGLAKHLAGDVDEELTGKRPVGTPTFMAPEQCKGDAIGPKTDVYAVACILVMLLTGRPPFLGETPLVLLASHVHEPPPRLDALLPGAPARLVDAIDACLRKDPDERPTAAELRRALAKVDPRTLPSPPASKKRPRAPAEPTLAPGYARPAPPTARRAASEVTGSPFEPVGTGREAETLPEGPAEPQRARRDTGARPRAAPPTAPPDPRATAVRATTPPGPRDTAARPREAPAAGATRGAAETRRRTAAPPVPAPPPAIPQLGSGAARRPAATPSSAERRPAPSSAERRAPPSGAEPRPGAPPAAHALDGAPPCPRARLSLLGAIDDRRWVLLSTPRLRIGHARKDAGRTNDLALAAHADRPARLAQAHCSLAVHDELVHVTDDGGGVRVDGKVLAPGQPVALRDRFTLDLGGAVALRGVVLREASGPSRGSPGAGRLVAVRLERPADPALAWVLVVLGADIGAGDADALVVPGAPTTSARVTVRAGRFLVVAPRVGALLTVGGRAVPAGSRHPLAPGDVLGVGAARLGFGLEVDEDA